MGEKIGARFNDYSYTFLSYEVSIPAKHFS